MPASATDSIQLILYAWFTTLGFILGLVVALICGHLVLDWLEAERQPAEQEFAEPQTVLMEVPQPLELPGGGWICCGDCYARLLLRQVPLPRHEVSPYSLTGSAGLREPVSTHRGDKGGNLVENGREPHKNRRERSLWVEQGESNSPLPLEKGTNDP